MMQHMKQSKKQNMLQCGSALKESGLMKKWAERLLIYDLEQKILKYIDIKGQTQKQLNLAYYQMREVTLSNGKWSIKFKVKKEFEIQPDVVKFGWESQDQALNWYDYFNGTYYERLVMERQIKNLEEWDDQLPNSERLCTEPVSLPTMHVKPSALSRMRQMIYLLPEFLQHDLELILANALDNLEGFNDIHDYRVLKNLPHAQLYQDTQDELHMKLIFYTKVPAQRIYDELVMPTQATSISPLIKQFNIFPAKKNCAIVAAEFDVGETVKIVYTQKHIMMDGLYCIIKKHTGQEINHDLIEKIKDYEHYKITRSVTLIQPSKKQGYQSQIIEEVSAECTNRIIGQKLLDYFFMHVENLDKFLEQSEKIISSLTQDIIVKNANDLENQQISFRVQEETKAITSEQHQTQSKDEYQQILQMVETNQYIQKAIVHQANQSINQGLNKQLQTTPEEGHFLYTKYYEVDPKKGSLIYLNKTLMSNQKKVIFDMLKRMGSNLMSGSSIMSVSLPIQIFESRSFLERMARGYGHAPVFLDQAALCQDPIEQMKFVMAFNFASFMMGIQQEKPFNPIIGETFQGRILGCPIYLEQTSHHPPTSNYIMYGRGYKLFGNFSPSVNLGTNSLQGEQNGQQQIYFENSKLKFYYINQPFTLYGVTIGQRSMNCNKRAFCFQPDLQLVGCVQFNPKDENASIFSSTSQKIDFVKGSIMKVNEDCIKRCLQAHKTNSKLNMKLKIKPQEIQQVYGNISGRWTSHLSFDGRKYWDIEIHRPYILELEPTPIPSDCIYRKDLLYMKMKEMNKGQLAKEQMEVDQRKDQQLRNKNRKKN